MKRNKSIEKIYLFICVITILSLAACQPTPENKVVIGKGEEAFYQMLINAGADIIENEDGVSLILNDETDDSPSMPSVPYDAPERLDYTLEFGNTIVEFCAPVYVPEYAIPVVLVRPDKISYSKVRGFLDMVARDEILYDFDVACSIKTKKTIQSQIEQCMHSIQLNIENTSLSDNERNELIACLEKELDNLYIDLTTAPNSYADAVNDSEFGEIYTVEGELITEEMTNPITINENSVNEQNYVISMGESVYSPLINIAATNNLIKQQILFMEMMYKCSDREDIPDINMLIEAAAPYSELLADDLTLINYILLDKENLGNGYQLVYKRKIHGVECNYANSPSGGWIAVDAPYAYNPPEIQKDIYKVPYVNEELIIKVDFDGRIYMLAYTSPMKIEQTIVKDAKLLPFNDIKDTADFYVGLHGFTPEDELKITITEVKLGLMRIDIPNNDQQYLMVPVWDFYGYHERKAVVNGRKMDMYTNTTKPYQCFLTINALDGSIIDRELLY